MVANTTAVFVAVTVKRTGCQLWRSSAEARCAVFAVDMGKQTLPHYTSPSVYIEVLLDTLLLVVFQDFKGTVRPRKSGLVQVSVQVQGVSVEKK
ncbi:hypothetical protein AVEN_149238-1 [Araneus ventricosus]|uniref:Uncharacterized protein n=1 Tax=Araneus ventricosus TaxID=182803 RepID=A0A4Y2X6S4_ARAVE|nr:hypothetical protein AVEN_149238-1 [Araneus ventricosus]